uniref:Uncharacterized protein n=1 Tax=Glossina austeni TaxID=7395 RepID=A0A1A9USR3_GLOAU
MIGMGMSRMSMGCMSKWSFPMAGCCRSRTEIWTDNRRLRCCSTAKQGNIFAKLALKGGRKMKAPIYGEMDMLMMFTYMYVLCNNQPKGTHITHQYVPVCTFALYELSQYDNIISNWYFIELHRSAIGQATLNK